MTTILDGKSLAKSIINNINTVINTNNLNLTLVVCIIGDDPASHVYVKNKEKQAQQAGINSLIRHFDKDISQEQLEQAIHELNNNSNIHGILVQMPLPKHLDSNRIINIINPNKDVDGLHIQNLGKLYTQEDGLTPCTPTGIITLLKQYNIKLSGSNTVIIGRSRLVGKPLAQMLINESATVTLVHSHTNKQYLQELLMSADIIIVAIGQAKFLNGSQCKANSTIIDVGINRMNNKLVGDVNYQSCLDHVKYITPVPGGIGPLTVALLMFNTLKASYPEYITDDILQSNS